MLSMFDGGREGGGKGGLFVLAKMMVSVLYQTSSSVMRSGKALKSA